VAESIAPNYDTELVQLDAGEWDQINDNRYKDRLYGSSLSCLSVMANPDAAPNDMGINIMDYGDDNVSIVFSKNQVDIMRQYLQSDENSSLTLKAATDISVSSLKTGKSDGSGGLSTGALIGIVAGAAVLLLIVGIFIWYRYRRPHATARAMASQSYLTPAATTVLSPA